MYNKEWNRYFSVDATIGRGASFLLYSRWVLILFVVLLCIYKETIACNSFKCIRIRLHSIPLHCVHVFYTINAHTCVEVQKFNRSNNNNIIHMCTLVIKMYAYMWNILVEKIIMKYFIQNIISWALVSLLYLHSVSYTQCESCWIGTKTWKLIVEENKKSERKIKSTQI